MNELQFCLASGEHARQIEEIRNATSRELTLLLGPGHWSSPARIASIRERIKCADPERLRKLTLFAAVEGGRAVGSIAVSTFLPGFWKRKYWTEPTSDALGVFNLAVHPIFQRRGIGAFLMQEVEALAMSKNLPYIRLDAYATNPMSNRFYEAIGYQFQGMIDVKGVELNLYERKSGFDLGGATVRGITDNFEKVE